MHHCAQAESPPSSADVASTRFFACLSDGLMADRRDNVQGHGLVGQEPQGPAGMPCGRCTAPERDQSCLALAIQAWQAGGARLFLPVESGLKTLFDQPLS